MKKSLLHVVSILLLLGVLASCMPAAEVPLATPSNPVAGNDIVEGISDTNYIATPQVTPTMMPEPSVDTDSAIENSSFSVHFIDVGQADAALVECDGQYMLIDGGNKADSNVIYSVFKKSRC